MARYGQLTSSSVREEDWVFPYRYLDSFCVTENKHFHLHDEGKRTIQRLSGNPFSSRACFLCPSELLLGCCVPTHQSRTNDTTRGRTDSGIVVKADDSGTSLK